MIQHELKNIHLQYTRWDDSPAPLQDLFALMMGGDKPQGEAFYKLYFYWYYIAHELGHVLRIQYRGKPENTWEEETAAHQFAVSYWRAKGQFQLLLELESMVRRALQNLPDPVPADADRATYFNHSSEKIASDPAAFWGYQFYLTRANLQRPLDFPNALRSLLSPEASDGTTIPLAPDFPLDDDLPFRTVEDMRKTLMAYGLVLPDVQVINMYSPALQFVQWEEK